MFVSLRNKLALPQPQGYGYFFTGLSLAENVEAKYYLSRMGYFDLKLNTRNVESRNKTLHLKT